jgi:tryptophan-rich sensory protein
MPTLNVPALLFAVALSLGMAIVGGLLTGNQLTQWFATLRKPRFQLPLWGFVCVGLFGYIVDSIIAYRLLTVVPEQSARIIALTALIVVMLYNELWNIVLFRWHNTLAGFLGVLEFFDPARHPPGHARARGFRFGLAGTRLSGLGAWLRHSLGLPTLASQSSRDAASSRQVEAEGRLLAFPSLYLRFQDDSLS